MTLPKVSIVTITRNDLANLEKTVDSISSQDYPNLEFVLIDGNSTDGTQKFIQDNVHRFDKWISEPDKGIYDAMNKGSRLSTGDWILFMNAGDSFASNNTVSKVFSLIAPQKLELVGGRCAFVNDHGQPTTEFPTRPVSDIWRGMPVSHQTVFSRRSLLLERPFSLNLKVAADFEFIYNSVAAGASFEILDLFIAKTDENGISRTARELSIRERKQIVTAHDKRFRVSLFFLLFASQAENKNFYPCVSANISS